MSITFVGAETFAQHSSGPSAGLELITVDVHANVLDGDVLIAQVRSHRFISDPTLGGAWTLLHETAFSLGREYVLWRAASSEPASYTWTMSTDEGRQAAAISAWRGVDNLDPVNVSLLTDAQGGGTTIVAPAVTTDVAGCEIVRLFGSNNPGTITPPATSRYASEASSLTNRHVVGGSSATQVSPGGTGTASASVSGTAGNAVGTTIALTPGEPVVQPTADAGPAQTVDAGATVQLAGQASGGAGIPFTFQWRKISGNQTVAFTPNATTADATFDTAVGESDTIVLGLVVTDSAAVSSAEDTVTITVSGPANLAVPDSDQTVAGWETEPDSAPSVFSVIDVPGDDAEYAFVDGPVGTVPLEVGLSELSPASGSDAVTVRSRVRIQNAASAQVTVILKEGASTVIATFGPELIDTNNTVIQLSHALTTEQIESIGDFANLRLRWEVSAS